MEFSFHQWLFCNYLPGGNVRGRKVYEVQNIGQYKIRLKIFVSSIASILSYIGGDSST